MQAAEPTPTPLLDPVQKVAAEIRTESTKLTKEAESMRWKHRFFTVMTVLLGVAAPAVVTYTPGPALDLYWKPIAIAITAFATASATIRTVLRYGDRYANSALTAIAFDDLCAQLFAKREEVLSQVKEEYVEMKLLECCVWAQNEMFRLKKAYVEKEVTAITKERRVFEQPPRIEGDQKADPSRLASSRRRKATEMAASPTSPPC
jgi:hypothetical protein